MSYRAEKLKQTNRQTESQTEADEHLPTRLPSAKVIIIIIIIGLLEWYNAESTVEGAKWRGGKRYRVGLAIEKENNAFSSTKQIVIARPTVL